MNITEVKALPYEYEAIIKGSRTYHIVYKKFHIQNGDVIKIKEYVHGSYTGRECEVVVDYVHNSDGAYGLLNIYSIICFRRSNG